MAQTINNKIEDEGKTSLNKQKRVTGLKRFGTALLSTAILFGASQVYGGENCPSNLLKTDKWEFRDYRGNKVVFTAKLGEGENKNYDLFLANKDGSGQKRLTNTPKIDEFYAYWTNDGKIFGYEAHDKPGEVYFFMRDGDGKNKRYIGEREFTDLMNDVAKRFKNHDWISE